METQLKKRLFRTLSRPLDDNILQFVCFENDKADASTSILTNQCVVQDIKITP